MAIKAVTIIKKGEGNLGASRARGASNAISISKIKKRIIVIKKRIENGARAFVNGSKPHSKGVDFSRSFECVLCRSSETIISAVAITVERIRRALRAFNS